jgi:hypothetical protein
VSGFGTGYPNWFKCARQRRTTQHEALTRDDYHQVVRTGRTKPCPSPTRGHPRKLRESHEYVCSCGHRGWSCHVDVLQQPLEGAA